MTNEYWSTLAKIAVHVLDRFKPSKNGRIPKCEQGVEASLVECKYEYIKTLKKKANKCSWYVKKDGGVKCSFG